MSLDDPPQRAQDGASIQLLAGSLDASTHLGEILPDGAGDDTRFPLHPGTHTRRSLVVPVKSNHVDFVATHVAHAHAPHQRHFLTSDVEYFDVADGDNLIATVDFVGGVSPPLNADRYDSPEQPYDLLAHTGAQAAYTFKGGTGRGSAQQSRMPPSRRGSLANGRQRQAQLQEECRRAEELQRADRRPPIPTHPVRPQRLDFNATGGNGPAVVSAAAANAAAEHAARKEQARIFAERERAEARAAAAAARAAATAAAQKAKEDERREKRIAESEAKALAELTTAYIIQEKSRPDVEPSDIVFTTVDLITKRTCGPMGLQGSPDVTQRIIRMTLASIREEFPLPEEFCKWDGNDLAGHVMSQRNDLVHGRHRVALYIAEYVPGPKERSKGTLKFVRLPSSGFGYGDVATYDYRFLLPPGIVGDAKKLKLYYDIEVLTSDTDGDSESGKCAHCGQSLPGREADDVHTAPTMFAPSLAGELDADVQATAATDARSGPVTSTAPSGSVMEISPPQTRETDETRRLRDERATKRATRRDSEA